MQTKRLKIKPDQKWVKMHQCLVVGCVCICRRCWVELTGGKKSVRSLTQRKVKLESSWERSEGSATKTFPDNWDSKAPSVGTLLVYLETSLNHILFRNKTFFFKIESWNFQHLFKKRPHKISLSVVW